MHIFESQMVRNVIHALPIPIVAETLGLYHFVDFCLGCQSLTVYVWLCEYYTHEPTAISVSPGTRLFYSLLGLRALSSAQRLGLAIY